jgi:positive regulator of sigma E activity
MNKTVLRLTFASSLLLTAIGGGLKIIRVEGAELLLVVGLIATWLFLSVFILEVIRATYVKRGEKFKWIAGFIFLGWFTAFLYLIKYRRVQAEHQS